jgi:hypothetical protein
VLERLVRWKGLFDGTLGGGWRGLYTSCSLHSAAIFGSLLMRGDRITSIISFVRLHEVLNRMRVQE